MCVLSILRLSLDGNPVIASESLMAICNQHNLFAQLSVISSLNIHALASIEMLWQAHQI
jgi:hypothetical protein